MKTEKIEVRLTTEQKAEIQKVADEFGWTTSKLFKEMFVTFMYDVYEDQEKITKITRKFM